ncbi:MAG: hypothetical protein GY885_00385, partial [Phycisphaeraceae bacterium]|nr:hypothetical protein [Phycisphaeraceae bacterium]
RSGERASRFDPFRTDRSGRRGGEPSRADRDLIRQLSEEEKTEDGKRGDRKSGKRSGKSGGPKEKSEGAGGGKQAARRKKARSGDRIGHGGRRKGASKPVSRDEKPGGGVKRPK